ncbi:Cytochrome c2 iso-2 [Roseivivax jejudonensis]|uniref:Cytochrome c2 iso-2 n=1 Tax=Roseivivax jejudonensis TaxID=1529041 RepID=A0A1X6ZT61_9RHOB|nr:c-type cytochrome [Roseivivax jejudonensis]SLN60606.1 Cytochrome c2 iso-2 [Roseivivax jejudonensis]
MHMRSVLMAAMLVGAAAPLGASEATFEAIKVEAGAALFSAECRRCHAPEATDASYGPPLAGVVGRRAGGMPDFAYSEVLAGSGIVWTPAALRVWMADNDGFMPGTRMRHVGIEDPTVQDFILAYLMSLGGGDSAE